MTKTLPPPTSPSTQLKVVSAPTENSPQQRPAPQAKSQSPTDFTQRGSKSPSAGETVDLTGLTDSVPQALVEAKTPKEVAAAFEKLTKAEQAETIQAFKDAGIIPEDAKVNAKQFASFISQPRVQKEATARLEKCTGPNCPPAEKQDRIAA